MENVASDSLQASNSLAGQSVALSDDVPIPGGDKSSLSLNVDSRYLLMAFKRVNNASVSVSAKELRGDADLGEQVRIGCESGFYKVYRVFFKFENFTKFKKMLTELYFDIQCIA